MYALKRNVEQLKKSINAVPFISFSCDENFNAKIYGAGFEREYVPEPTLLKIHKDFNKDTVVGCQGPFASGKSTGLGWQILFLAANMPACKDGVRRSKFAFIRNFYDELRQTTYDLWISWFGELGDVRTTLKPLEFNSVFYDAFGKIEIQVQFLAIDKPKQFAKLKSANFTAVYINECCELPDGILEFLVGRTGRFPSPDLIDTANVKHWYLREIVMNGKSEIVKIPYWSGVLFDTNPPEIESTLHDLFEVQQPKSYKLYRQPPGLFKTEIGWEVNPNAENIQRMGLDYYYKQTHGATEEFIKVYCCGEYGSIRTGKLIYENYNDDIHSVDNLSLVEGLGLRLSFDTWFNPAVNISQYANEQLRVLAALWEPNCCLETFIKDILKPYLNQNFHNIPIASVVFDPAGMTGELAAGAVSDYQVLCNAFNVGGINIVNKAPTNNIKPRINSVEHLLKNMARGQPRIILDRKRCDFLRKGFVKHYVWRETKTTRELIYDPVKNKYSHNQDALQYEALTVTGIINLEQNKPGTTVNPVVYRPQARGGIYAGIR